MKYNGKTKTTEILIYHGDKTYVSILYKGTPKMERPKTYRPIGVFNHNIGNLYNESWLYLLKARKGYRYEIYRDGCFYPFYGKIDLPVELTNIL